MLNMYYVMLKNIIYDAGHILSDANSTLSRAKN